MVYVFIPDACLNIIWSIVIVFNQMLEERMISREWIDQTLKSPDHVEEREDCY